MWRVGNREKHLIVTCDTLRVSVKVHYKYVAIGRLLHSLLADIRANARVLSKVIFLWHFRADAYIGIDGIKVDVTHFLVSHVNRHITSIFHLGRVLDVLCVCVCVCACVSMSASCSNKGFKPHMVQIT